MSAIQESLRPNVYSEGANTPIPMIPISPDLGNLSHDIARPKTRIIKGGAAATTLAMALSSAPVLAQDGQDTDTGLPFGAIEQVVLQDEEATIGYGWSFNEPTRQFMNQVLNQEPAEDVSFEDLKRGIHELYDKHGDEISCIDVPGVPFLAKKDMRWMMPQMKNGTPYSRELAAEATPEESQEIIDSSRLVTASELLMDFMLIHDNTSNSKLRKSVERGTGLVFGYIASSVETQGETSDIAQTIGGAVDYQLRNYRDKIAYPPVENC